MTTPLLLSGKFLEVTDAAELIGVTPQAVRLYCETGKFAGAVKLPHSGAWLIPRDSAEKMRKNRPKRGRPKQEST